MGENKNGAACTTNGTWLGRSGTDRYSRSPCVVGARRQHRGRPDSEDGSEEAELDVAASAIHDISSSGMFAVDAGPNVPDTEKLRYVCDALGHHGLWNSKGGSAWVGSSDGQAEKGSEPYIVMS